MNPMVQWQGKASPRSRTMFVGAYYLLTAITSGCLLYFHGGRAFAADLVVTAVYLAITALFYVWSKPQGNGASR